MMSLNNGAPALCVLICACGSDLPNYNEVHGLRVLAVAASPSWLGPGAETQLEALVVSPDPVQYRWSWCPWVTEASGNFICDARPSTLPTSLPSLDLGQQATAQFGLPTADLLKAACLELGGAECDLGFDVQIRLEVKTETDEVVAFKTLHLWTQPPPTQNNPRLSDTAWLDTPQLQATQLSTVTPNRLASGLDYPLEAGAAEGAQDVLPDGSSERLLVSWFVDGGELKYGRTPVRGEPGATNTWTAPAASEAPLHLYVVLRDGRGGTTWQSYAIELEAP